MEIIALTGLIGAGKSTIAEVFASIGIPCYNTDKNAKRLMRDLLKKDIEKILGKEAYYNDGNLNKKYIGQKIFTDNNLRNELNQVVHPAVKKDFLIWAQEQKDVPYVIIETAILYESSLDKIVDKIILVSADISERIQRVIKRDNLDESTVKAKIRSQQNETLLKEKADFIIDNNDSTLVIPQVLQINDKILKTED